MPVAAARRAYGRSPPCLWLQPVIPMAATRTLTVSSAYAEAGARGGSAAAGATMAAGASVAAGTSAVSSSTGEAASEGDGGIGSPLAVHLRCWDEVRLFLVGISDSEPDV
jgi:hypothetical protein